MLEYPLISTIQTLKTRIKELLSLWLSSFLVCIDLGIKDLKTINCLYTPKNNINPYTT